MLSLAPPPPPVKQRPQPKSSKLFFLTINAWCFFDRFWAPVKSRPKIEFKTFTSVLEHNKLYFEYGKILHEQENLTISIQLKYLINYKHSCVTPHFM